MAKKDIRWQQRFSNFEDALTQLTEAITITQKRKLTALEEQGLIQGFEYNFELAWNCLKDICEEQGITDIIGSKDAIRYAFKRGLIENGDVWMEMVKSRILTTHTYHRTIASEVAEKITTQFYPAFLSLQKKLQTLKSKQS